MTILNTTFLLCFLPISLVLYYISNDKFKEYILLGLSLLFYALGSLEFFELFLVATIVNVAIGRGISKIERKISKRCLLTLGIIANVGLLGYYKYTDFVLTTINDIWAQALELQNLLLPLGISFFTFKAISYLVDVYKGEAELDSNPIHDMLYLSFFPQIQAGPITRYNSMKLSATSKSTQIAIFSDGVFRFLIGFIKKVLIANTIANISNEVFACPIGLYSSIYFWFGSICYSLQIFYDFAGYSDMAIGLSKMFGYDCMENFYYPYMTESVAKFWRRWHISLSQWFRDYIYIPMGGSRNKNKAKVYFNLFVVWALTGIWHGASWSFVVWGLGFFLLISLERLTGFPEKFKSCTGKFLYRIFALLFINLEWIIFRAPDLPTAIQFIGKMFAFQSDEVSITRTLFLLKDNAIFLILAIILCFPIIPWIDKKTKNNKTLHTILQILFGVLVVIGFVWAVSFIISGQNNPFAYANF